MFVALDHFFCATRDPSSRRLMRNISSNSSCANNQGLLNTQVGDDTTVEDDRLPYQSATSSEAWEAALSCGDGLTGGCATACTSSTVSGVDNTPCRTSFDSMRPHLQCRQTPLAAQPMQLDAQQLLIGTSAGIFQLNLSTLQVQLVALVSVPVAHICYSSCGLLLAACPVPEEAHHGSGESRMAAKEAAGLYCVNLKQQSSCSGSDSSFGVPAMKLWEGGAT
jgi:hypothetical protein